MKDSLKIRELPDSEIFYELESRGIYFRNGEFIDLNKYSLEELEREIDTRKNNGQKKKRKINPRLSGYQDPTIQTKEIFAQTQDTENLDYGKINSIAPDETILETPEDGNKRHKKPKNCSSKRFYTSPPELPPLRNWYPEISPGGKKREIRSIPSMKRTEKPISNGKINAKDAWQEYFTTRSEDSRNTLMIHYRPLVVRIATHLPSNYVKKEDLEDLVSDGLFGLKEAIEKYKLERGVKFETYAAPRIRGAILDAIRARDIAPRLVRARSKKREEIKEENLKRGNHLSEEELDKLISETAPKAVENYVKDSKNVPEMVSIEKIINPRKYNNDRAVEPASLAASLSESEINLRRKEIIGLASDLLARGANRIERAILTLYYFEGLTMKEIGRFLDLSEPRVSQIHGSIIERLRAYPSLEEELIN